MTRYIWLLALALATPAAADEGRVSDNLSVGEYAAEELLQTCQQADNDSRRGTALEIECEQYLIGYADALGTAGLLGAEQGICLPEQNAADEMRWAFVRWVHAGYSERSKLSAAEAMRQALPASFPCS